MRKDRRKKHIALEPKPGEWINPRDFAQIVRLTPLVAIDLVVRSPEGRFLVGRRTNEPAKNLLFVPGSRISKNETRASAFRRITREELGIELRIEEARFLGVYDHLYSANRFEKHGFGTHYVTLAYEISINLQLEMLPRDQHAEYHWLSPQELLNRPDVHENTKAYFITNRQGVCPSTSQ